MLLLRRFVVLIALFFWQGGFTFYASVVVPVGQQVHGHRRQGFITQKVTDYMNLTSAIALAILFADLIVSRDASAWRRWGRWLSWAGMVVAQIVLYWLHGRLDELLVRKGLIIRDEEAFGPQHRLYLWVSTVQWGLGLLYLLATLAFWRSQDRTPGGISQKDIRSDEKMHR